MWKYPEEKNQKQTHFLDDSTLLSGQVFKKGSSDLYPMDRYGDCQDGCLELRMEAVFPSLVLFFLFYFYYFSCRHLIATFTSFETQDICFPGWGVQCTAKTKKRRIHLLPHESVSLYPPPPPPFNYSPQSWFFIHLSSHLCVHVTLLCLNHTHWRGEGVV